MRKMAKALSAWNDSRGFAPFAGQKIQFSKNGSHSAVVTSENRTAVGSNP